MDRYAVHRCLGFLGACLVLLAACAPGATTSSAPPQTTLPASPGSSANGSAFAEQPWEQLGDLPGAENVTITDIAADGDAIVVVGAARTDDERAEPHFWLGDASGDWISGTVQGSPATGFPSSVAATGSGWITVGWDGCSTLWPSLDMSTCSSVVWSSPDGLQWTRLAEAERPAAALMSILEWRGQLLAAGGTGGPGQDDSLRGLVMASTDGQVWDELVPSPTDALAGATITDLVLSRDEVVAVAISQSADIFSMQAVAWTTADGTSWRGPEPMDSGVGFPTDVAVSPSGLVAVGFTFGSEFSSIPTAWTRASGGWQRSNMAGTDEGPALVAVAGSPAGALIAGYDPNADEFLLFGSADGEAWMRIPNSEALALPGQAPMAVAWAGDRFLLVVTDAEVIVPVVLAGVPHLPTPEEVASASPTPGPPVNSRGEVVVHIASGLDVELAGTAECSGRQNGPLLEVRANDLGEVDGYRVTLDVVFGSGFSVDETPNIEIGRGVENAPQGIFLAPYYSGDETTLTLSGAPGDWTGRIDFVGLYMVRPGMDVGEPVPLGGPNGPELIDGYIDWTCPF